MVENARCGGQRVGVVMELEKEKLHSERSEERGRRKDGESGTASELKTGGSNIRNQPARGLKGERGCIALF